MFFSEMQFQSVQLRVPFFNRKQVLFLVFYNADIHSYFNILCTFEGWRNITDFQLNKNVFILL